MGSITEIVSEISRLRNAQLEINKKIGIHHSFVNPTFKKSSLDASSLVISTEAPLYRVPPFKIVF